MNPCVYNGMLFQFFIRIVIPVKFWWGQQNKLGFDSCIVAPCIGSWVKFINTQYKTRCIKQMKTNFLRSYHFQWKLSQIIPFLVQTFLDYPIFSGNFLRLSHFQWTLSQIIPFLVRFVLLNIQFSVWCFVHHCLAFFS